MTITIGTGDCYVYPTPIPSNAQQTTTDGIGCCVALGVEGKTDEGEKGACFAHLDSRQYLIPARGGKLDLEVPSVTTIKKFLRAHPHERRTVAATNFEDNVDIRGNLYVRYGLNIDAVRDLQAGGNRGVVTFDPKTFTMYDCAPSDVGEAHNVRNRPPIEKQPDECEASVLDRIWQWLHSVFGTDETVAARSDLTDRPKSRS